MFAKLLKHDIRAVLKYWWIGAVVSVGCAILGGICCRISFVENTDYIAISNAAYQTFLFCSMGIMLLPLFTYIILLIRYQKHFFSDEGYLTFTLPVKKTALVDSKLAVSFLFSIVSSCITFLCFMVMNLIADDYVFGELSTSLFEDVTKYLGGYTVPYVVLSVLVFCMAELCYIALIYVCLTISSLMFKKHKILAGLGIYTAIMWLLYVVVVVIFINFVFGMYDSSVDISSYITTETGLAILLGITGVLTIAFGVLYYILTVMLHKKLNLA